MKIATSVTTFNDAVGVRMSITYSEISEDGSVVSDNKRVDRVITDANVRSLVSELTAYAQEFIDNIQ